jgi:hypothetical protein
MTCFIWNLRGVRDANTRLSVREEVFDYNVTFVGLVEIKMEAVPMKYLNFMSGRKNFI